MPKSTKAAPPQQANLQEMWAKKKEPKTQVEPKVEPKIESNAMEVDSGEGQKGVFLIILKSTLVSLCSLLAESSKRKERALPATCMCLRSSLRTF